MPSQETRDYWVEISSQILNALFTITGLGLLPWRTIDTYRIGYIWTIANRVWRRRKQVGKNPLEHRDDLPQKPSHATPNVEKTVKNGSPQDDTPGVQQKVDELESNAGSDEITVRFGGFFGKGRSIRVDPETLLTLEEEEILLRQQIKFQQSQTWYRPHETATHWAFPLHWAVWIMIFNDANSIFQIWNCVFMWGWANETSNGPNNYHNRPVWGEGLGIPLSFLGGIAAGLSIWLVGNKTKKETDVTRAVKAMLDQHKAERKAAKEQARQAREAEQFLTPHHSSGLHAPHLHVPVPSFLHHHSKPSKGDDLAV